MQYAIRLSDISYTYKNGTNQTCAIDHLSLNIQKGSFVCILGSNGSGKSTLAKLINGILTPSNGSIERLQKTVSLVFQNPDNQIVASVVNEDTAFGPENLGIESSKIKDIVNSSLKQVSVNDKANDKISTLSGGQKQRVCIAGALAMQSTTIVFDEPCSMLDPKGSEDVLNIIKKLNKNGCTVILITHDMDLASQSQRTIVMHKGKTVIDGPTHKVLEDIQNLKQYNLLPSPLMEYTSYLKKAGFYES